MNIAHLLSARVATHGDHAAILDHSRGTRRRFNFVQIDRGASNLASQLLREGLQPGDAVLLLHPVSAELFMLFIAVLRCGLVAVFIDPSEGREHLERCCALRPPRAMIGCAKAHLLRLVSPALRRIPLKFSTDMPVWGAQRMNPERTGSKPCGIHEAQSDAPAIIRFTSGSTGQPKAAVRTHGYLLEQQRVLQRSFGLTPGEVDLVTMPLFVLSNLAAGVTSLIPPVDLSSPGCVPPATVLEEIQRERPQRITAAPALLYNLAEHCRNTGRTLEGVERIFTGGAPVFPRLLEELKEVAPGADIVAVYGSTEAEPIALLHYHELSKEDRARPAEGNGLPAGTPDEAIRIRILREDGTAAASGMSAEEFTSACLPAGEMGEVVVAGPHVLPGYLSDEDNRRIKIRVDGEVWHRTGDAGYLDNKGRLWLLGRSAARICDPRGTLYPFQVEGVAMEAPWVRRAALFARDGRRVLAIESREDHDRETLMEQLAWARLDAIQVVARLPVDRRHNSKIDYQSLEASIL